MAAKVVIVAVPAVLSIASIRVYTVREAATDGLVTREKLNIYTPLPQSAQPHFAPESPGVIQNGLTTARERIQPFFQAVKGACVSVKKGTVNLYHAGEDVYYYLKDPPPEFLPRFGTITMAGLLGMFLARKGSRFKRVAVPMGLMSAGASVCYPAQAVAVLKVTGKKVYAAGQWSSAAVSSLLTPKPQEPVTKEIAASLPQATTVLNPESSVVEEASEASSASHSSAQSSTIPETEVESVESVPVSDEPIVAVVTKEASSVTLAEISPDQTPTETNTDPVAHAVQAETETTSTPEEIPAPVESEEPSQAAKDVSTDTSPAESTPNLEPETTEAVPAESAPVESAPVAVVPVEVAPVEPALDESAPAESMLAESAPVDVAPVEPALDESAPAESASAESAEVESASSSEELPAPKSSDEPAVPVVESAEPDPDSAPQPELADPTQVAAVEETLNQTLTPQPPQQPAVENRTGGSVFKPDPAVMDFGQSNPEDEDLYSTRS